MSHQNVDFIRTAVELGNAGKLDALAELCHPEIEFRDLEHPPDIPEVLRGRAAIRASWERWLEALGDWNVEVGEYVDADAWVVCDMRWTATGRGSGAPIELRVAEAFEVENRLIVRLIAGFPDVATALSFIARVQ
jgi:ketosteroid isomerase-like protein